MSITGANTMLNQQDFETLTACELPAPATRAAQLRAAVTVIPGPAPSPWGCCVLCDRPIYSSFVTLPAVRRGRRVIYTMRAHDACYRHSQNGAAV